MVRAEREGSFPIENFLNPWTVSCPALSLLRFLLRFLSCDSAFYPEKEYVQQERKRKSKERAQERPEVRAVGGYDQDGIATGMTPVPLRICGRPAEGREEECVVLEEPAEPVQMHWTGKFLMPHYRLNCPHCARGAERPKPSARFWN
jgi:hypothetical protein